MASSSETLEPSEYDCSVCHELFTEPKLLPCGHLLCRHCLLSWLQSQSKALCPLCRCAIVDADKRGRQDLEDVVDSFPTDLVMAELVEAYHLLSLQHECCVCVNVTAVSMCLTCRDLFCQTCATLHQKQTVSKGHDLQLLTTLTAERVATSRPVPCADHADQTCEMFCRTHDIAICYICASCSHRSCQEVEHMEEKMQKARAMLGHLAEALNAGETLLAQDIENLDLHVMESEVQTQATLVEIDAACDHLQTSVEMCRLRLKDLVLSARSDVIKEVDEGRTILLPRRGKLSAHKRVVERAKRIITQNASIQMTELLVTRMENLDRRVLLAECARPMSTLTFSLDPAAIERIEKELEELGQLKKTVVDLMAIPISFHDNHGMNIVLTNDRQTAKLKGHDLVNNIVMMSQPMKVNTVYEVQLGKREVDSEYCMAVGISTDSPDNLDMSYIADQNWTSCIVIFNDHVDILGKTSLSTVGTSLGCLPENSRVGVLLDDNRSLHLYINGQDEGIAAHKLPDTCFPFFDMYYTLQELTILQPVRHIDIVCGLQPVNKRDTTSPREVILKTGKFVDALQKKRRRAEQRAPKRST